MTYVLITEDGQAQTRPGTPDLDELSRALGGEVPELIPTGYPDMALWVGDDYMSAEAAGRVRRNVIGTVASISTGATRGPYSGPMVFTGRDADDPWNHRPTDLDASYEMTLLEVVSEIRAVLQGDGSDDHVPAHMQAAFRFAALMASNPYPDGSDEVTVMTAEEFLRSLGR